MIKEQEKEDDQAIEKVDATIKTDEEQMESIMKGIKQEQEQSSEKSEIKKEMGQLNAGQFDSMLASGQAAVPEAKEKEQAQKTQAPPAPQVAALTKVAQNLGDQIKPRALDLADLKSAQAQIQQMINSME